MLAKLDSLTQFVTQMDIEMSALLKPVRKTMNENIQIQNELQHDFHKLEVMSKKHYEDQLKRVQNVSTNN